VTSASQLMTDRLLLRRWRVDDLLPLAAMNADEEVMAYFPSTLSFEESAALIERIEAGFESHGYGPWALEVPGETAFAGFVGLSQVDRALAFAPAVEIGWRLARRYWGRGFATEAATAVLAFGFERHALREIVSFTSVSNLRSRKVMERLGMRHDTRDDFEHPLLAEGHPLRPHVLYRLVA
jgi:RimJ/RimL family protein N-acetyltransferase